MQQTLSGCAFCEVRPGSETGEALTWGKDERVTHPICVDCALQERPDPDERDHHACDGCGLVVDALAALTRFRVELGASRGTTPVLCTVQSWRTCDVLDARFRITHCRVAVQLGGASLGVRSHEVSSASLTGSLV